MAIQARCPHCQAKFSVKDELDGKKIRCKECDDSFTVGDSLQQKVRAGTSPAKKTRLAPPLDEQDDDDRRRPDRGGSKRRRDDDEDDRPRKRRDEDDDRPQRKRSRDDDEDDRPRKKRRDADEDERPSRSKKGKKGGSSAGLIIGLAAGGVLMVGSIVVVVVILAMSGGDEKKQGNNFQAKVDGVQIDIQFPNGVPIPDDIVKKFPKDFPKDFPDIKAPNLPVKKRTGDDVVDRLADLKTPFNRGFTLKWYAKNANPSHPRRAEVSTALLDSLRSSPFDMIEAGEALMAWAGKENVEPLVEMINKKERGHHQAMMVLAKLKDPAGFEPIASRLPDFFDRAVASKALKDIGQPAESAVIPYVFHTDGGVQQEARKILEGFGTSQDTIRSQALKELQGNKKAIIVNYLVTAQVEEGRRDEVAKALEPLLKDPDNNVRHSARRAFNVWAGAAQVPQLIAMLQEEKASERSGTITALARHKEDRVAEALCQQLVTSERGLAAKFLIEFGNGAEKHVLKYLHSPNPVAKGEASRILKAYGTNEATIVDFMMGELKSPDNQVRRQAVDWFFWNNSSPSRKDQVLQALNPIMAGDSDPNIRQQASIAWRKWGGNPTTTGPLPNPNPPPAGADLASLIKIVESPGDPQTRHQAMDQLAQLRDPRGAEAVAKCLMFSPPDRAYAAKTLKAMGPAAELPACFALLNSPDPQVRIEASHVLAAIGTRNSLPQLFKAMQLDPKNKGPYNAAIKAISSR